MSKIRLVLVLAILVVMFAVSFSILGVFASNSDNPRDQASDQSVNEAGMKIYQQSEWADYRGVPFRVIQEGMAIYHKSERNTSSVGPTFSNEEGLAIYFESERNNAPVQLVGTTQEGMAIYHASERNTIKPAERLYDGKPFNAYQRSEWLGAER
jgi:hypothetical protein